MEEIMNIVNKVTLTIGVMASAMATTLFTAMPKPQIAQSYQANAAAVTNNGAAQLKAMKMCNTDFKDKSLSLN